MPDKKFEEYINRFDLKTLNIFDRSIIYMYLGDMEQSKEDFKALANSFRYKSKYGENFDEKDRNDLKLLSTISSNQIRAGIFLSLSNGNKDIINQHFLWAAENSFIPDENIQLYVKNVPDDVAIAHLWRGYALLTLGNDNEACRLIENVVPYFNKSGRVYQEIEYKLPKALVPLCEYKLHPDEDHRTRAKKGLEAYIKSISNYGFRLWGYLYYFHLMARFPEVYDYPNGKEPDEAIKTIIKFPMSSQSFPSDESENKGSVIVFEKGSGNLEVIGSDREFKGYIEKVNILGDYPAIMQLLETYVLREEQEPEPLLDECNILLSRADLEPEVRRITEEIHSVATDALGSGDKVILYFDSEVI